MVWRLAADVVMLIHFAFIVFVVIGPLLAWRWPRLLWFHVPAALYGLAIVTVGFVCPLTPLENSLRERAGESGYDGGFVDRYIEGVIYPGRYTRIAQLLAALLIIVGYVGVFVLSRRRDARRPPPADRPRLAPAPGYSPRP
jgi:Protein of Unknown function (DUF2784)